MMKRRQLKNICPDCGKQMGPMNRKYVYPLVGGNLNEGIVVCLECHPIRIEELIDLGLFKRISNDKN